MIKLTDHVDGFLVTELLGEGAGRFRANKARTENYNVLRISGSLFNLELVVVGADRHNIRCIDVLDWGLEHIATCGYQ